MRQIQNRWGLRKDEDTRSGTSICLNCLTEFLQNCRLCTKLSPDKEQDSFELLLISSPTFWLKLGLGSVTSEVVSLGILSSIHTKFYM